MKPVALFATCRIAHLAILGTSILAVLVSIAVPGSPLNAAEPDAIETRSVDWKGYRKEEFTFQDYPAFVVIPAQPAAGNPWVWRTSFPNFHAEIDLELLKRGFHIAHVDVVKLLGADPALDVMDAFYDFVRRRWNLSANPALEAVSRGGLHAYRYAARRPNRIACIYADTPVMDLASWPLGSPQAKGPLQDAMRYYAFADEQALRAFDAGPLDQLQTIADAKIPLRHIISPNDTVVPPQDNTLKAQQILKSLGWAMEVVTVDPNVTTAGGHHFPLTQESIQSAVSFIIRHSVNQRYIPSIESTK